MEKLFWLPPPFEPINNEILDVLAKTLILLQTDVSSLSDILKPNEISPEARTEAYALLVELQEQLYKLGSKKVRKSESKDLTS